MIGEFGHLWERLPGILKTIVVIPAGYVLDLLDTPTSWMVRPMIAVATLNLIGVRLHSPHMPVIRGQVILGSAVSLYFTLTVAAALAGYFLAIVAANLAIFF